MSFLPVVDPVAITIETPDTHLTSASISSNHKLTLSRHRNQRQRKLRWLSLLNTRDNASGVKSEGNRQEELGHTQAEPQHDTGPSRDS